MRSRTPAYVKDIAKELRKTQTKAENILWEKLRGKRLYGYKFYRQCPIGRYIADFYCYSRNLAIEVDGEIHKHETNKNYDKVRQAEIEGGNIKVLRFSNDEVISNIEIVLQKIYSYLKDTPSPNAVGEGDRG